MSQQKFTTKIQQRHTLISSQLCPGPEYVGMRKVKMLVAQSCLTLSGPHGLQPARLLQSMDQNYIEFSRQEYWSGLPFPFPGALWDPGIKPRSTALQVDLHYHLESPGKPLEMRGYLKLELQSCRILVLILWVKNWAAHIPVQ